MRNRWMLAIMGTVLMLCLGTVYAWSYFQDLLVKQYGWSNSQVAWIFALAIFFVGAAAAVGGPMLPKVGPRRMAMLGGMLFSLGYAIAAGAIALRSLPLLYVGYGLVGGIGLGPGYVTPVATVTKWFPDRKGFATGMVIMGFGLGALFMSKILAPLLIAALGRLDLVFLCLAGVFMLLTLVSASFMRNPEPAPGVPRTAATSPAAPPGLTPRRAILSGRFALLWLVFFCNITAGIAIISFQSPLLQDLWKRLDPSLAPATLAAWGATLIAASSLFNGAGRFLGGAVSDRIGRTRTFRIMLASEIVAFVVLMLTGSPWVFGILVCWVLLCYGGGFGTMPSFIGDVFGPRLMATVYGAVLTAWSVAGVVGPQLVAILKDSVPDRAQVLSFAAGAGLLAVGFLLSLALSNRPMEARPAAEAAPARAK
jgi:OFA family oxalate/formate antiporter-like MFS transporter